MNDIHLTPRQRILRKAVGALFAKVVFDPDIRHDRKRLKAFAAHVGRNLQKEPEHAVYLGYCFERIRDVLGLKKSFPEHLASFFGRLFAALRLKF